METMEIVAPLHACGESFADVCVANPTSSDKFDKWADGETYLTSFVPSGLRSPINVMMYESLEAVI